MEGVGGSLADRDYGGHVMPCPVRYSSLLRYMSFGLCTFF